MSNRDALKWLGRVTTTTRLIAQEIADHLEKEGLDLPRYGSPQNGPVMWGYNPDGAEHGTVVAVAAGDDRGQWPAPPVDGDVNLGRQATA